MILAGTVVFGAVLAFKLGPCRPELSICYADIMFSHGEPECDEELYAEVERVVVPFLFGLGIGGQP